MKILFVFSRNRIRSLTAERHLSGRPGPAVRSAETAASDRVRITAGHPSLRPRASVGWADVVVVMEKRRQQLGDGLAGKRAVCLHIPDDDTYGDKGLPDLIEAGVEPPLDLAPARAGAVTP